MKITVTELYDATMRVAAENPDFNYVVWAQETHNTTDCLYFIDNDPACIIGRAFASLGLSESDIPLHRIDDSALMDIYSVLEEDDALAPPKGEVENQLLDYLCAIQAYQDTGFSWEESVERASGVIA